MITGIIKAVCISEQKGTEKRPAEVVHIKADYGIDGDAHAGKWHRQVSLLCYDRVVEFNQKGANVSDGDFGENFLVEGIDFKTLPVGTIFKTGDVVMRLTQIGKECHSHCAIFHRVGTCIMPHEGVFAEVLNGGDVKAGDLLTAIFPEEQNGEYPESKYLQ